MRRGPASALALFTLLLTLLAACKDDAERPSGPGSETPSATALRAQSTPAPARSPTATPLPQVYVPPGCSEWPDGVVALVDRLPTPERLCLKYASELSTMPVECQRVTACYLPDTRTVWKLEPSEERYLPRSALTGAGLQHVLSHEVCHAYQHWYTLTWRAGTRGESAAVVIDWLTTPQGKAYLGAESRVHPGYMPFPLQPIENFAEVCAAWLAPQASGNRALIDRWPSLKAFAETWLAY